MGVLTKFRGFVSYFTTADLRRPCHVLFFIASTQKDTVLRSLRHIESPGITFTTERSLPSAKRLRFLLRIYHYEFLRFYKFSLSFSVAVKVYTSDVKWTNKALQWNEMRRFIAEMYAFIVAASFVTINHDFTVFRTSCGFIVVAVEFWCRIIVAVIYFVCECRMKNVFYLSTMGSSLISYLFMCFFYYL